MIVLKCSKNRCSKIENHGENGFWKILPKCLVQITVFDWNNITFILYNFKKGCIVKKQWGNFLFFYIETPHNPSSYYSCLNFRSSKKVSFDICKVRVWNEYDKGQGIMHESQLIILNSMDSKSKLIERMINIVSLKRYRI